MKTLFISLLLGIFSLQSFCQTFKVTDWLYSGEYSKRVQAAKQKALGSIIKLTFYDRTIRLSFYDKHKKDSSIQEVILDKIDENTYHLKISERHEIKLVLNRKLYYIVSATLTARKHYDQEEDKVLITTMKRENIF